MDALVFWFFATITVLASLLVVGQKNPMYSVLLLLASFGGLVGLYVTLDAPFVAAIQIIIYAGAVIVLFLFVVMLLNVPAEDAELHRLRRAGPRRFGAVLAGVLAVELTLALSRLALTPGTQAELGGHVTTVYEIGVRLFHDYAFAFEATSVLILVAMVGAVVLAGRESR